VIPLSLEELKNYDYESLKIVMPEHLFETLIGEPIAGTDYFGTLEGDPTPSGYHLLDNGNKIYRTEHQPTGSSVRYRKINSIGYGVCWEVIPDLEN